MPSEAEPASSGFARRGHQVANRGHHRTDRFVVARHFLFQFGELFRKFLICGDHLPQADEGTHDKDTDINGTRRVEDTRRHDRAVLGKREWSIPLSAAARL
jgi:hypothetical protein